MANEQNLKPMGSGLRSESEERALRVKGGVNSGKTRRRKRAMKDAAKLLLNMPIANQGIIEDQMRAMGFDEKDLTNQMALLVSMWRQAVSGSVPAAVFLRDTAGQNARDVQQREEFEYRKERDAGISQEIEDLDEIEAAIYGTAEKGSQEGKKEEPEKETNNTI